MEFTEKQLKNFWSFLVETFEFTEEQNAAIDHQIPMTQEIYNSILDRCNEIGSDLEPLFLRMLTEYQDFMSVYADRMEKELDEKYPDDGTFKESTPEELEKSWQDLCRRIREEYGEDAIYRDTENV